LWLLFQIYGQDRAAPINTTCPQKMYQIRILKYVHVYRQKIVALLEFDFDLRLETPTQTALGGDRKQR